MPILLRIILQRLLLLLTAVLAYFGISPEVNVPTEQEAYISTEERKQRIVETLEDLSPIEEVEIVIRNNLPETIFPTQTNTPEIKEVPIETPLPEKQTPFEEIDLSGIENQVKTIQDNLSNLVKTNEQETPKYEISSIKNVSVNIVCTHKEENKINVSTGSGTIISPQGVVLTNAHVAQYFLLENYPNKKYDCVLRKENIPTYGYKADLLFIQKEWVEENYYLISADVAEGTGEDDYAFLVITDNTNPALSLPLSFPYLEIETNEGEINIGDDIVAAGYPGFSSGIFNLNTVSSLLIDSTNITDVFTFNRTSIDVFSTGVTKVAQRGSSGGGVFKDNKLLGMITTTSPTSSGDIINAVSLPYINRDVRSATGLNISSLISGNVKSRSINFEYNEAPELINILIKGL